MKLKNNIFLISLSVLQLCACTNQQTVNFSVVKQSQQCRFQNTEILAFSDEQNQNKLIKNLAGLPGSNAADNLKQLFNIHLAKENLFLVTQGMKPSAGYGFNISAESAILVNNSLTLPITFSSPEPDTMQAQMITSPCLVLGIDSKADYDRLIIDSLELSITK
jgi:hypothetical protein